MSVQEAAITAAPNPLPNSVIRADGAFIDPERRNAMIAEAAFYRAERREFESGYELEDWLAAESEIDGKLMRAELPLAAL